MFAWGFQHHVRGGCATALIFLYSRNWSMLCQLCKVSRRGLLHVIWSLRLGKDVKTQKHAEQLYEMCIPQLHPDVLVSCVWYYSMYVQCICITEWTMIKIQWRLKTWVAPCIFAFEVVSHAEPNSQILWELPAIVHAWRCLAAMLQVKLLSESRSMAALADGQREATDAQIKEASSWSKLLGCRGNTDKSLVIDWFDWFISHNCTCAVYFLDSWTVTDPHAFTGLISHLMSSLFRPLCRSLVCRWVCGGVTEKLVARLAEVQGTCSLAIAPWLKTASGAETKIPFHTFFCHKSCVACWCARIPDRKAGALGRMRLRRRPNTL